MTKHLRSSLILLLLVFSGIQAVASPTDSVSTKFKDGYFTTYCCVLVNTSDSTSNNVVKDFNYQMRYNLNALFGWALKGLNLHKEHNELMMFYFKSTQFDSKSNIIKATGDVIVPGIITVPDIHVDSYLWVSYPGEGKIVEHIDLRNGSGFIKNMNNTFVAYPAGKNKMWYVLESRVNFGWFFNIFITEKRFKSIMEWRLKTFLHNLKTEAEKRQTASMGTLNTRLTEKKK